MLQATNIHKRFGNLEVLKGVDIQVNQGEVVAIVGSSGAGKSTLLHILGTLEPADTGTVIFNGQQLDKMKGDKLAAFRNKNIGFVFQFHHLLPEFTVLENVLIPSMIAKSNTAEAKKYALELLSLLCLSERAAHKPNTLSGGEAQRAAVARALINKPALVCADEPSGNLDSANALSLHQLFFDLRNKMNQTFIIVTHNEQLSSLADRKLHMADGKIVG